MVITPCNIQKTQKTQKTSTWANIENIENLHLDTQKTQKTSTWNQVVYVFYVFCVFYVFYVFYVSFLCFLCFLYLAGGDDHRSLGGGQSTPFLRLTPLLPKLQVISIHCHQKVTWSVTGIISSAYSFESVSLSLHDTQNFSISHFERSVPMWLSNSFSAAISHNKSNEAVFRPVCFYEYLHSSSHYIQ